MLLRTSAFLQDPFAQKEEYKDSWFDKFMVNYFAKQMSKQLGGKLHFPVVVPVNITLLAGSGISMRALKSNQQHLCLCRKALPTRL